MRKSAGFENFTDTIFHKSIGTHIWTIIFLKAVNLIRLKCLDCDNFQHPIMLEMKME